MTAKVKEEVKSKSKTKVQDNLSLWNKVQTSKSETLKGVNLGRKFKSINAHSQVMAATEQFGPMGLGWGYEPTYEEIFGMLRCQLKMWAIIDGQRSEFYSEGGCAIEPVAGDDARSIRKAAMANSDIFKKATTDALTKGLSVLGFNADVFLGLWDDNKYVQEQKRQEQEERDAQLSNIPEREVVPVVEVPVSTISEHEVQGIIKLAKQAGTPIEKVLNFAKVGALTEIDATSLITINAKLNGVITKFKEQTNASAN
jgi:hypothetical protein|tara:strand:+ start:665 stop:1432 length:768 start_codon:yes stop_codon:yes gene_type:complete